MQQSLPARQWTSDGCVQGGHWRWLARVEAVQGVHSWLGHTGSGGLARPQGCECVRGSRMQAGLSLCCSAPRHASLPALAGWGPGVTGSVAVVGWGRRPVPALPGDCCSPRDSHGGGLLTGSEGEGDKGGWQSGWAAGFVVCLTAEGRHGHSSSCCLACTNTCHIKFGG